MNNLNYKNTTGANTFIQVSLPFRICYGMIMSNGYCSDCHQKSLTSSGLCSRLVPVSTPNKIINYGTNQW